MDNLDLKSLGLEKKWPRLSKLREEVSSLGKRHAAAENQVRQLEGALAGARARDLDAAAAAVRKGKEAPRGTHEESARRSLEAAQRDRDILAKATESASADLAQFMAKHQGELYEDVVAARAEIAREVAQAASEALRGYAKHEDLALVLKRLQPPVEVPDWDGPPNPNSTSIIGVHVRRSSGPERGTVEGLLGYLISLAEPAPGDSDAA